MGNLKADAAIEVTAAEMPSNIALIKYMGKVKGAERNKPTNSSLSLTLNHLRSRVEIQPIESGYDIWEPLVVSASNSFKNADGWMATHLSERGRKRYLAHFEFLKQKLGIVGHFTVKSANNFPSDCGIASSASSFAALTQASFELALKQNSKLDLPLARVAELSRIGSGSSIRSFLSPYVLWSGEGISVCDVGYADAEHQVVVVEREKKSIGSSDAHERVTSSLLFHDRPVRAERRLTDLIQALRVQDWSAAYQIIWAEFWDMHALFATSQPAFQYMLPASLVVLNLITTYWREKGDGPLVTMDAGANVHLIYRADQAQLKHQMQQQIEAALPGQVVIL